MQNQVAKHAKRFAFCIPETPNQLVLKVSDFIQSLFSEDACPKSDKSATGMNTIFCHQIFSMSPARSARELGGSPFS